MRRTGGFALIAALWLIIALAGVVGLATGTARLGQTETLNRIALARGRWAAEACLAIAQARWDQGRLADTGTVDLGQQTRCSWRLTDPTTRLNVNVADSAELAPIVCPHPDRACGLDSLLRLRDAAPLTDLAQAAVVPGVDSSALALLTVDGPGSITANSAPPVVLRVVPGMTAEARWRLENRRLMGRPYPSLDALAADLSPPARDVVLAHYADLAGQITFTTSLLRLTSLGWVEGMGAADRLHATVELLVVPLSGRLATVRRRMW